MPFACSICEVASTRICAFCTKDACDNHICEHCGRCSDCCECEVRLDDHAEPVHANAEPVHAHVEAPADTALPQPDPQPSFEEEPPPEPPATSEV